MTKWEYYRAHILWDDNEVWQRSLDALGSEGWEMVGFEAAEVEGMRRCYFKRAIPEVPQGLLVYHDPAPQKRDFGKEESDALDALGKELFYEDDDADRWHDAWQKLDEYMRDQ